MSWNKEREEIIEMRNEVSKLKSTKYQRMLEKASIDAWAILQVCLGFLDPSSPESDFPKGRIKPVRQNLKKLFIKFNKVAVERAKLETR